MYLWFLEYSMQSIVWPLPSLEDVGREPALADTVERCCGFLGAAVLADPDELGQGGLDANGDQVRPAEVVLQDSVISLVCNSLRSWELRPTLAPSLNSSVIIAWSASTRLQHGQRQTRRTNAWTGTRSCTYLHPSDASVFLENAGLTWTTPSASHSLRSESLYR
jgi:hypothetical protein